jgi:hypothetical protein
LTKELTVGTGKLVFAIQKELASAFCLKEEWKIWKPDGKSLTGFDEETGPDLKVKKSDFFKRKWKKSGKIFKLIFSTVLQLSNIHWFDAPRKCLL